MRRAERGRVRLGASPASATQLVTEAVVRLAMAQPELQIAVLAGVYHGMLRDLLAGDIDLFVCVDNDEHITEGITREVLLHDEYRVVCAMTHPLARASGVTAAQLSRYPWIMGRNLGEIELAWRRAFEQADLPAPQAGIETTSVEFGRHALEAGGFLTVLPSQLIASEIDRDILCVVDAPDFRWQRPIALHYRRSGTLSPGVLAVIDALHRSADRYRRLNGL
ncbi:MAG: substrate-binding domain-containing protein [Steroidobacteraceae bacterium]